MLKYETVGREKPLSTPAVNNEQGEISQLKR